MIIDHTINQAKASALIRRSGVTHYTKAGKALAFYVSEPCQSCEAATTTGPALTLTNAGSQAEAAASDLCTKIKAPNLATEKGCEACESKKGKNEDADDG